MSNQLQLVERTREFLPRKTNYALAKALEMTQSQLNRVLKGDEKLGVRACVRISEITKIPLTDVIALVEVEKARTDESERFWKTRLPRFSATVVIAVLATQAFIVKPASAIPLDESAVAPVYIIRTWISRILGLLRKQQSTLRRNRLYGSLQRAV